MFDFQGNKGTELILVGALLALMGTTHPAAQAAPTRLSQRAAGIPFCTKCVAAGPPIAVASLVAHAHDIPGFAHSKRKTFWTESPSVWSQQFTEDTPTQATAQANVLTRWEFQMGAQSILVAPHRTAISDAMVFNSAHYAELELNSAAHQELDYYETIGFDKSTIAEIPESVVFGNFNATTRETTAAVLFSRGRCVLAIGDDVRNASTGAQGSTGPIAAAKVLYKRVKHACA